MGQGTLNRWKVDKGSNCGGRRRNGMNVFDLPGALANLSKSMIKVQSCVRGDGEQPDQLDGSMNLARAQN